MHSPYCSMSALKIGINAPHLLEANVICSDKTNCGSGRVRYGRGWEECIVDMVSDTFLHH